MSTLQDIYDLIRWHPRYEADIFKWFPPSYKAEVQAAIASLEQNGKIHFDGSSWGLT